MRKYGNISAFVKRKADGLVLYQRYCRVLSVQDCRSTVELSLPYTLGTAKLLPDETFENFDRIKELWGYEYTEKRKQELFLSFLSRSGLPKREDINP